MNILIVDDHAVVRKGLRQIIADDFPNANIQEAADTPGMLEKVENTRWDVIICDINMPGPNGVEALKQVKGSHPDTPILIMSMNSEDQYALRVMKSGAAGYLSKDTVHEDIISAIAKVTSGKKFITPSVAARLSTAFKSDSDKKPHEYLSNREFDVMKMLAAGNSVSEIAARLFLNNTTVSTYRSRIFEKTGMKTNADLTRYAIENNLL